MKVALLSLRWCQYGGWPTYKKHLFDALVSNDVVVEAISIEKPKGSVSWVKYVSLKNILEFLKNRKYDIVHITILNNKLDMDIYNDLFSLKNIVVTLHDPSEYKKNTKRFIVTKKPLVVFIREKMLTKKFAIFGEYLPHPYKRQSDGVVSGNRVVATSRIDFDKNTDMIIRADCGVEIFSVFNGMYDHLVLSKIIDGGISKYKFYKGEYKSLNEVFNGACALVDMSTIHGDGGGTQYTFLEAMDYGLSLILNSRWFVCKEDELKPFVHYTPVSSSDELRGAVLEVRNKKIDNAFIYSQILLDHDYKIVGKLYKSMYEKFLNNGVGSFKIGVGIFKFF